MTPKTREEAIASGSDRYFTGNPCKNGNVAMRRVSNWQCLCEPCLSVKVARVKKWRHENSERSAEHSKEWKQKNPEQYRRIQSANYKINQGAISLKQREYRLANRDAIRAKDRQYYEENKAAHLALSQRRKAARRRAVPTWLCELDKFVGQEANRLKELRKQATGFEWHVDHMIPLRGTTASGLHVWNNLQVIPASVNLSKSDSMILTEPGEWLHFCARTGSFSIPLVTEPA